VQYPRMEEEFEGVLTSMSFPGVTSGGIAEPYRGEKRPFSYSKEEEQRLINVMIIVLHWLSRALTRQSVFYTLHI